MLSTLHGVVPLTRGTYSNEGDPDPIAWRGGSLVEYMDILDPTEGVTFRVTVGEELNGFDPRASAGEAVDLVVLHLVEDKIVFSEKGKAYTTPKHKLRVLDVKPAAVAK